MIRLNEKVVNGMAVVSGDCDTELVGYVVIATKNGRTFAHCRIFQSEQLAAQEAARYDARDYDTAVDRLSMQVEYDNEQWYEAYCPTLDRFTDQERIKAITGRRVKPVNGLCRISGGRCGKLGGFIVLASDMGRRLACPRIFHCLELAEQEAIHQSTRFSTAFVDSISMYAQMSKGWVSLTHKPTIQKVGKPS